MFFFMRIVMVMMTRHSNRNPKTMDIILLFIKLVVSVLLYIYEFYLVPFATSEEHFVI